MDVVAMRLAWAVAGYAGNRLPKSSARDPARPGSTGRGKREAASLATLRLTGETLKPFAAIQRASAGSRSAAHCRTGSIRWIAPRFSLLSAQMAGVPCLVVGPLH